MRAGVVTIPFPASSLVLSRLDEIDPKTIKGADIKGLVDQFPLFLRCQPHEERELLRGWIDQQLRIV